MRAIGIEWTLAEELTGPTEPMMLIEPMTSAGMSWSLMSVVAEAASRLWWAAVVSNGAGFCADGAPPTAAFVVNLARVPHAFRRTMVELMRIRVDADGVNDGVGHGVASERSSPRMQSRIVGVSFSAGFGSGGHVVVGVIQLGVWFINAVGETVAGRSAPLGGGGQVHW